MSTGLRAKSSLWYEEEERYCVWVHNQACNSPGWTGEPSTFDLAQDMAMGKILVDLDKEFREQRSKFVDLIDERKMKISLIVMMMNLILNVCIKKLILISSSFLEVLLYHDIEII